METNKSYRKLPARVKLNRMLRTLPLEPLMGSWSYTVGVTTIFAILPDFLVALGKYAYSPNDLEIISAVQLDSGLIILALMSYLFALFIVKRTPKLLVLRAFADSDVDAFLRLALGGLGMRYRPIWLSDTQLKSRMKKNLLGVNLYLTQIVPWVVYGFGIIGLVKGNLPYELLWVAWFIVGSFLFYKYQAGKSASYWIAFLLSSSVMFLFHAAFLHHLFVLPTSRWLDAFQVVIWALILCCAIYQILERFTSIKIALSSLYFHRQVDTYKDLLRYKRDIEDRRLSNRYIPNASVAIAELQSSHALWREVVSVSISNCSMLLADITHILPSSSLAWELSKAYKNGIGVFLLVKLRTC
ncbi:hypothetical protein MBRA_00965 [Methylobacterium brachiatum]|nr:hypothetical protein MBRA_00965 [Methylobacterium brachiatum]